MPQEPTELATAKSYLYDKIQFMCKNPPLPLPSSPSFLWTMDSDTTSSSVPFSSDIDDTTRSIPEPPSSFSSSPELDDTALTKTPTMPVINRQTEQDKTPTQTAVLKYKLEHLDKFTSPSPSRRLFIIPPTNGPLSDDSDLEVTSNHTRPLIHLLNAAVQRRQSESAILRPLNDQLDWTKQLPMKVLQRIFLFYLCFLQASLHPINMPYVVPCATSGPLLLSQICKYWRDTALASPSLWGSLSATNNQPDIPLLESWLARSCHTPLSLRLKLDLSPTNAEYVGAVLSLFALHHERWQTLDLRLNDVLANQLCTILALSNAESPIAPVRSVRLDTKSCSVPVISKMLFALERYPTLQEIFYSNRDRNSFLSGTISGSPIWSRLTCIDIGSSLSQFNCISFLSQCTSATSITFQNIYNFEDEEMPHASHISLLHLQHLDIVVSTVDVCSTILAHLTCPSLSTLSIVTASNATETPPHLGAFLIRSACPLRLLNIYDWMMDIHTLFSFIRAVTASGAGVGSRKRVKTLGIYSTEMPRKRENFYDALKEEEEENGSLGIGIDGIDYWALFNPDGLTFRTRVGWGKRPAYLWPFFFFFFWVARHVDAHVDTPYLRLNKSVHLKSCYS